MKSLTQHLLLLAITCSSVVVFAQGSIPFETVPGDPLNARIYTLNNGLTVFTSVFKDEPRIQTYIAVRAGSKNDPAETTGLAHYFEHMMFKGTPNFGTIDWEAERPLIEKIEKLFEKFRVETDPEIRTAIYRKIDSISFIASKLAIPNEYDKLMTAIGSQGTNAGTSHDFTIYIESIPSNQLENWAVIQHDRFKHNVLRLFHTELETVYEEKNMSLTNDSRRASEAMLRALFPNHPYGQQTTLGEAEHLKNPSMKNIREFFATYYVPSNIAIALSGDFDPDKAVEIINRTLGQLPAGKVPDFVIKEEEPILSPKEVEVIGQEAENVRIAYRFAGAGTHEALLGDMLAMMLSNGEAGLIDLNINQKQRAQWANAHFMTLNDHSALVLSAGNRRGQTLEEVRDLLLEQVELLQKGEFPDWMLEAAVNNLKLREMKRFETNAGRAMSMAMSFIRNIPWSDAVTYIARLNAVTKEELVAKANEKLGNNYVVVYKRQGMPGDLGLVAKPSITPVHINRDAESEFFRKVKNTVVEPIKPVFLDYSTDLTRTRLRNGLEMLYVQNTENATFNLIYYFDFGSDHDKMINLAAQYLQFLGTSRLSSEEISQEFFKLACTFSVTATRDQTSISLSGLSENQEKAVRLLEELLVDCQPNQKALDNLVATILKARADAKANQNANFQALVNYATFGPLSPTTNILSEAQLKALTPQDLISIIRNLNSYPHTVIYYGPLSLRDARRLVQREHKVPRRMLTAPEPILFEIQPTDDNRVFFAHYDANQAFLQTISRGVDYDMNLIPEASLYNAYFGGGMNAIVFQELRERRGLAYTARSRYATPARPNDPFMNTGFIATQNDKVIDAFDAFNELFDSMPLSEKAFQLAQESILSEIATNRITRMGIVWDYLSARRMNRNFDIRTKLWEQIPTMTLQDVEAFNHKFIRNRPKTYVILSNEAHMDFDKLQQRYGTLIRLTREDIFGY